MTASISNNSIATSLFVLVLMLLIGCISTQPRTSLVRVQGSFAAKLSSGGAIMGRVLDPDLQEPWPARVTVRALEHTREFEKAVKAEESGYYWVSDLPDGIYRIEITLVGFIPATHDSINVKAGRVTVVDVELAVEASLRDFGYSHE